MPLPKTYFSDLSEEAQIAFFDFWIADEPCCSHCPGWKKDGPFKEILTIGLDQPEMCNELCGRLFNYPHNINRGSGISGPVMKIFSRLTNCPCSNYGKETALAALEKAILEWIGE